MAESTATASWSRRPESHIERTTVIGFVAARLSAAIGPVVAAQLDAYRAAEAEYRTTSVAHDAAWAAAERAGSDLAAADARTVAAFRRWQFLLEGHLVTRVAGRLAPALGDRPPARFLVAAVPDKIETFPRLFAVVARSPQLVGDAAAFAALRDAAETLAVARLLHDDALVARANTVRALKASGVRFDRQYGLLVKAVLVADPDGVGADLPRFRRPPRGRAGDTGVPASEAA